MGSSAFYHWKLIVIGTAHSTHLNLTACQCNNGGICSNILFLERTRTAIPSPNSVPQPLNLPSHFLNQQPICLGLRKSFQFNHPSLPPFFNSPSLSPGSSPGFAWLAGDLLLETAPNDQHASGVGEEVPGLVALRSFHHLSLFLGPLVHAVGLWTRRKATLYPLLHSPVSSRTYWLRLYQRVGSLNAEKASSPLKRLSL